MGKRRRKADGISLYLMLLVAIVLISTSFFLIFNQRRPFDSLEVEIKFEVADTHVGFDVNTTSLVFGRTSPGGPGITRFVDMNNTHDFPIEIEVFLTDNVIDAIEVNSTLYIEPKKSLRVPIKLNVPENFALGNYSGKIKFEMYKAG